MKWRRKKKKEPETILGSRDWPAVQGRRGADPFANQPGPCKMCGATNYVLSYGGPDVCPSCDAGGPTRPDTYLDFSVVSSSSPVMWTNTSSPNQLAWFNYAPLPPPNEDALLSDEYKEFLAWKQKREEDEKKAKEEPPKLVRPMRLIEL